MRDRGRGDGWAEFDEMIFKLAAQGLLDGRAGLGLGEGWKPVLQMTKVGRKFGPQNIRDYGYIVE